MSGTAVSSGALAVGTTVLANGHSFLDSIILASDGTNAPTVTIYDGVTAAGTVLAVVKGRATDMWNAIAFNKALRADIGITVVVAGTNAVAYIGFGAA